MSDTDAKLEAVISESLGHAHDILSAFNHVVADPRVQFTLAACCAMVQNESGGQMVWGHDEWNAETYPKGLALPTRLEGAQVTSENYHDYRARRNQGMQPQGCGITQLTSASLQIEAERAGGCWVPFYNCKVGFMFLHSLFEEHGSALAGFTAYNGSGPAAEAYGQRAVALSEAWQGRFDAALR